MLDALRLATMVAKGRSLSEATPGEQGLGPLQDLPKTWSNLPGLPGRGWNMIALPFASPGSPLNYRLLLNQYNEVLTFSTVDGPIPNRGIKSGPPPVNADQILFALDYEQVIDQIAGEDFPVSGTAIPPLPTIHHEPGLWLHLTNEVEDGFDIARLATIPHGNSVLAIGKSSVASGAPCIPDVNGLPIGVSSDLSNPYLAPYKHFHDSPFLGLFDPTVPTALLRAANAGVSIRRTTTLTVDTENQTGGIVNIPFIVKQADAVSMRSTFWIQELDEVGADGRPKMRLQYAQVVMLDFFDRTDGLPGRIGWPHISINTLERID
jgi:hypothetical protein